RAQGGLLPMPGLLNAQEFLPQWRLPWQPRRGEVYSPRDDERPAGDVRDPRLIVRAGLGLREAVLVHGPYAELIGPGRKAFETERPRDPRERRWPLARTSAAVLEERE